FAAPRCIVRCMAAPPFATLAAQRLVALGDQKYLERDWAGALAIYRAAHAQGPAIAAAFGLPLMIGHCVVELAEAAELAQSTPPREPIDDSPRVQAFIHDILVRIKILVREGQFARASALLRLLRPSFKSIQDTYDHDLLDGTSDWRRVLDQADD